MLENAFFGGKEFWIFLVYIILGKGSLQREESIAKGNESVTEYLFAKAKGLVFG